jgi:hypothetical protein
MNIEPLLAWEKWVPKSQKIVKDGWDDSKDQEVVDDSYQDEPEVEEPDHNKMMEFNSMMQQQMNPFALDIDDFNFWTCHHTFRLNRPMMKFLRNCSGTESIELQTPHRMRISIGKLFRPGDVMSHISTSLCNMAQHDKTPDRTK